MSTIQEFDFNVNVLRALLWQYNDAEKLQSLLQSKQDWYTDNQKEFWSNWYDDVFNLDTANEFGLSVWSIILDLPLFVSSGGDPLTKPTFGFGNPSNVNFSNGNFSSFAGGTSRLSIETKRIMLKLRYYQITSSGTVPETNRMLANVFGDLGQVYLLDGLNMTQIYVFGFTPDSEIKYILDNFDLLPRPAGVESEYVIATKKSFGFGQFNVNFNNGTFSV